MKKIIYSAIFFLTLGLLLPQLTFAIGQMTKPIVFEEVLRGQEVQDTLLVFNSENKEVIYGITAEGAIKNWTSFYAVENTKDPISQIKVPARSKINIVIKFKVPSDTPNGTYTGQAIVFIAPEQDSQARQMNVAVGLSIGRDVSIKVTDKEIIKFSTTIIPLEYAVGKGKPLKIKAIYDNQGNVTIKPDIQVKITQLSTGIVVSNIIYPYPEKEEAVRPFEMKEFPNLIEWQTAGQENGKYRADIKVLLSGTVYKEESFRFDIGIDIMSMLLANIAVLGGGNLTYGWIALGAILLVIAGILAYLIRKPQLLKVE